MLRTADKSDTTNKETRMKKTLIIFLMGISVSLAQTLTIAEARLELGNTVITSGIVTTPNLASSGESDFAIQDETAAIILYTNQFDAGLVPGDLVTVTGEIQNYNGKLEVVPTVIEDVVLESQGNDLPAFQYMTLSGLLTDPESLEAELIEVFNVEIIDGTWPDPGNNANLTITDDGGVTILTLRVDRHSDVDDMVAPTGLFNLKGNIGQYDYSEPQDEGYQIIPRYQTDIAEPDANLTTIFNARNAAEGTVLTTQGFITSPVWGSNRIDYGLQDATGGIALFLYGSTLELQIGDFIQVTGAIEQYNGKAEIVPADVADITVIGQGNPIPAVQELTIADFLADPESYESEILKFTTATIIGGTWPSPGNDANLTITDVSEAELTMRVDKDTDVDEGLEPQGTFELTGLSGQYDSSDPYDSGYQILPRFYADIVVLGDISPVFTSVTFAPENPTPDDVVTITAEIVDDGTVTAQIIYVVNDSPDMEVDMATDDGSTFTGTISAQSDGDIVTLYILADDGVNEAVASEEVVYVVHAPESLTPIYDIQYTADPSGDSPLLGQTVTIGGIVTAEFWGGSSNRNFYVQDEEAPYCGVVVFEYGGWDSFELHNSLGEVVESLAEGDSVVVTGVVDEYYGKTEIVDVTEVIVYGPAGRTIEPLVVTPGQIMTGGTDAEAYEGVLVSVNNVTIDNNDLGYGEWSVSDGTNSVRVDDNWEYYFWPELGQDLDAVTGVLDYAYSNTKIQPRLARDVKESGAVRIQYIQQNLYSDLLKAGFDAESDQSYFVGDTVTIVGIVTMPTGLSYAGDGVKFIFADPHGGPWSGILSYDPDSSAFPVLYEGDLIQATGFISEYTTAVANMTELFITEPVDLLDMGLAMPEEPVVSTGDLRWPTEAEQWGTVMVKIENGIVTNDDLAYEVFAVDDGTGQVLVDDDSDSVEVYFDAVGPPPIGTQVESVRGWVYHHFGSYADSSAYKLCPLYASDIVFGDNSTDTENLPKDFRLYANYPNPFNPETQIRFDLGVDSQVKLVIYDILGRQVCTLTNEYYSAGSYILKWNGTNSQNQMVGSGVYLYRIKAGNFVDHQKMILVR